MGGAARTPTPYDHFDNPYEIAHFLEASSLPATSSGAAARYDITRFMGGVPATGIKSNTTSNQGTLISVYLKGRPDTPVPIRLGRGETIEPLAIVAINIATRPTDDLVLFG